MDMLSQHLRRRKAHWPVKDIILRLDIVNKGHNSAAIADEPDNSMLRHEAHDAPPNYLGVIFILQVEARGVRCWLERFYTGGAAFHLHFPGGPTARVSGW